MSKLINFIKLPFDIADDFDGITGGGGICTGGVLGAAPAFMALLQLGQAAAPSGKFAPQFEQYIAFPPLNLYYIISTLYIKYYAMSIILSAF